MTAMPLEDTLHKDFPEATAAECKRFATAGRNHKKKADADAIKEDAEKMLEDYLDWRSCYGFDYKKDASGAAAANIEMPAEDEDDDDAAHWDQAVKKAMVVAESMKRNKEMQAKLKKEQESKGQEVEKAKVDPYAVLDKLAEDSQSSNKEEEGKSEKDDKAKEDTEQETKEKEEPEPKTTPELPAPVVTTKLPQIMFLHTKEDGTPATDKNGKRVILVLPAMVDRKLATSDTYALAMAFYLNLKFDRNDEEKMTVIIDVRPGDGWPNQLAITMVNFVRTVTTMLQRFYPERLERLVLFPIPMAALMIWQAMKRFVTNDTMDKLVLVPGPAACASPVPKEVLKEYFDIEIINLMEEKRVEVFKPIGTF
jgi:hypothetical protein